MKLLTQHWDWFQSYLPTRQRSELAASTGPDSSPCFLSPCDTGGCVAE